MIDLDTHAITLHTAGIPGTAILSALITGPDGRLWFADLDTQSAIGC